MARVMKQQESLNLAFKKRIRLGLGIIFVGAVILLFSYYLDFLAFNERIVLSFLGIMLIFFGVSKIDAGHKFKLGAIGESRVTEVLTDFPEDWYIFNDMFVDYSQIDHIVVCTKGIYTIETKNYKGTIYGNAEKQKWSQVINYDYKKLFYNPVKQGIGHSVALSKYLEKSGFKNIWVNTIVVFAKPIVELKVFSPKVPVIYLSELTEFFNNRQEIINSNQCIEIAECINKLIYAKRKKGKKCIIKKTIKQSH